MFQQNDMSAQKEIFSRDTKTLDIEKKLHGVKDVICTR